MDDETVIVMHHIFDLKYTRATNISYTKADGFEPYLLRNNCAFTYFAYTAVVLF